MPRQIEVKTDDTLRPAVRKEGQTKYTTDFHPGDDGIYVEVSLPTIAARNEFRLAVAPKKGPPVAEQTFTWKRTDTTREFYFPLNQVTQADGPGDYQVRLYSGDRLEVKRGIKIKKD